MILNSGLTIEKEKRQCKVIDKDGNVVLKTFTLKDAELFVETIEENLRLKTLLESRGIAPHRIYLLSHDESKRGQVYRENLPAHEVVIIAKADDGVVVRHLHDGKEEIVDLEELEPIQGGAYLRAAEIHDETIHIALRINTEDDTQVSAAAIRDKENAEDFLNSWRKTEDVPGPEYSINLIHAEGEAQFYLGEISIED